MYYVDNYNAVKDIEKLQRTFREFSIVWEWTPCKLWHYDYVMSWWLAFLHHSLMTDVFLTYSSFFYIFYL